MYILHSHVTDCLSQDLQPYVDLGQFLKLCIRSLQNYGYLGKGLLEGLLARTSTNCSF